MNLKHYLTNNIKLLILFTVSIIFFYGLLFFPLSAWASHPSAEGRILNAETGQPFSDAEEKPIMQMHAYNEVVGWLGYRHILPDSNGRFYFPHTDTDFNAIEESRERIGTSNGVDYYGHMAFCSDDIINKNSTNACPNFEGLAATSQSEDAPVHELGTPVRISSEAENNGCPNCRTLQGAGFGCGNKKTVVRAIKEGWRCSSIEYYKDKDAVFIPNGIEQYGADEETLTFFDEDGNKINPDEMPGTKQEKEDLLECIDEKKQIGAEQDLDPGRIEELLWECNLSIIGSFWTNSGQRLRVPTLMCEPIDKEPEKEASTTEIDSPDDVGLSPDLKWACTRSQSCADEPESEPDTETDAEEDDQGASFTQDADNAQTGFCSPEAKKEENAPYTAIIPGVGNQMQRNGVSEENTGLWVLQCFNLQSVSAEPGKIETEILCTTGSEESDTRAQKQGVLDREDNWTYLVSEYGIESEIYGLYQNTQDNANPDREPIAFPLNPPADLKEEMGSDVRTDIAQDIEWATRFDPKKDVPASMKDYFFLMVFTQYGDRSGEQTQTYSMDQATLNTQTGCSLIQDPYGTVFDSYTLEPLADASVQLLRDNGTNYVPVTQSDAPAVTRNPLITTENGSFAFFVPDGRYKLDVAREGYTFPGKSSALNPSYDQLYSDIYQGEDIVQHGEIEHRDVPLDPVDKEAAEAYAEENPVQIISFLQSIDREHQEYVIEGRTTHPKAKVTVYGKEAVPGGGFRETREIERTEADMDGRFEVRIGLTTLQKGEVIGDLEVVKKKITPRTQEVRSQNSAVRGSFQQAISHLKDLTLNIQKLISASLQPTASSLVSHVQAAEVGNDRVRVSLDPILNTVKGYAKDENGNILTNATVGVYVPMSDTPVYETMTDEEGYFEIPSEELPNIEYEIRYEGKTGKVVQTSTSQFMAQNSDFISNENVDVYAYTPGDTNQESVVLGATDQVNSLNRQSIFIAVVVVLGILILSSITILGMYAYRNKKIDN